ncbi:MAG: exodeoxyribonuclease VII small subunit [Wenzhouxiangellaceae bacterium]|nr:exodeoxyribonuclease VII small subunit [Wenzhouxiangellaceae bacterium]
MDQDPGKADAEAEAPFEQQLAELESVVEQLESGELTLADSLARFERGVALTRRCQAQLDQAQQVVDRFIDDSDDRAESAETSD